MKTKKLSRKDIAKLHELELVSPSILNGWIHKEAEISGLDPEDCNPIKAREDYHAKIFRDFRRIMACTILSVICVAIYQNAKDRESMSWMIPVFAVMIATLGGLCVNVLGIMGLYFHKNLWKRYCADINTLCEINEMGAKTLVSKNSTEIADLLKFTLNHHADMIMFLEGTGIRFGTTVELERGALKEVNDIATRFNLVDGKLDQYFKKPAHVSQD